MLPGLMGLAGIAVAAAPPVVLTNRTVVKGTGSGLTAMATYEIDSDGTVRNHNDDVLETWLPAGASAADYQVKATLVSGATPIGSLGSWASCSVSRGWSETSSGGGGVVSGVISVSIRDAAAPNTVRATATITITADSEA